MKDNIESLLEYWNQNISEVEYLSGQGNPSIGLNVPVHHMKLILAELDRLTASHKWVSVKDALPEQDCGRASLPVLVSVKLGNAIVTYNELIQYWKDYGWVHGFRNAKPATMADYGYEVIAWMERPQFTPPVGGEK